MAPLNTIASPSATEDAPVLSWTVHLVRTQPERLAVIIPIVCVAAFCAYMLSGPIGTLIVAIIMTGSLSDFLFPVSYVVTPKRATCKRLLGMSEIRWENVRRCYLDEFGVKLSPLVRKTRLEAYRGVYLRFNNNQDQVIETVRSLRVN